MPKIEFSIINNGQICFSLSSEHVGDGEFHKNLLTAGYIQAISSIAENSAKGQIINAMEMKNSTVFINKSEHLLWVIKAEKKAIKEKRVNKMFKKLHEEFLKLFHLIEIRQWNGNVEYFDKFIGPASEVLGIDLGKKDIESSLKKVF